MATVKREKPADLVTDINLDELHIERLAEEFKKSKETIEILEKRHNDMKKQLSEAVSLFGYTDDKGHQWLKAGAYELKRERRVARSFDITAAEAWARTNGLWDEVKEIVEVTSEANLLRLAWDHKEYMDTVSEFYVEKESWAFKA
jgi:hypothetical protein